MRGLLATAYRLRIDSGPALLSAAIAGAGVIRQPEILVSEALAAGRLTRLLADFDLPARPLFLVYPPDQRPTAKLRAFIEFALSHLAIPGPQ
jgi:DNA-binding transcriptional LysR family regulator